MAAGITCSVRARLPQRSPSGTAWSSMVFAGTVRFYGCPAEEGGGGKALMARNGLFENVDAALTWHPEARNKVTNHTSLATCQVYFKFKGRSAHASAAPHLGRSALDAVELMNVGCNYLREHIIPEARLHYAITNSGGISPNVVQAEAEVLYKLRTPRSEDLAELYDRICNVAKGAALMTGTELEIQFDSGSSELIVNKTLEKLMYEQFVQLGGPAHNESELQFAEAIRSTLTSQERTFNVLSRAARQGAGRPGGRIRSADLHALGLHRCRRRQLEGAYGSM